MKERYADGTSGVMHVNPYTGDIQGTQSGFDFRQLVRALHGWLLMPFNNGFNVGWYAVSLLGLQPMFVRMPGNAYDHVMVMGRGAYPLLFERLHVNPYDGEVEYVRRVSDRSALELFGKPRSLRAAGGIFFGTPYRQLATLPVIPARFNPHAYEPRAARSRRPTIRRC